MPPIVADLVPGVVVDGPLLPEPIELAAAVSVGDSVKLVGKGLKTGRFCDPILNASQLAQLSVTPKEPPFDGDAQRFRLGVEAARLGLAYEYDPYFSLSIARVDPLPHQLEAVYDYFLKLPRIRFLLADDPGAGKTIMAGLLLKELKIRGLVKRTLIVAPANLTFQWQREMKDKFREPFEVMRGDVLRANTARTPGRRRTRSSRRSRGSRASRTRRRACSESNWDLIIVDEAHKMSAYSDDKKTLAYQLGEALSRADRPLPPDDGDAAQGRPGELLPLPEPPRPRRLRRREEPRRGDAAALGALLPAPHEGGARLVPRPRDRRGEEALHEARRPDGDVRARRRRVRLLRRAHALRRGPVDQGRGRRSRRRRAPSASRWRCSSAASRRASTPCAAASSACATSARRSSTTRRSTARSRSRRSSPTTSTTCPKKSSRRSSASLEDVVASVDPAALREEIQRLGKLIDQASALEAPRESSRSSRSCRRLLEEQADLRDPKMKLLVFTEHKDTLDYLAGDGKDGRPLGKLREWGLTVTQIHGGMKIGDRDTPGPRIYAEREFREDCQVLVATEAAGEGINLQFCWFMINYDIPWNPVRLEQRMGRIHRYGQKNDCLIFNFVADQHARGPRAAEAPRPPRRDQRRARHRQGLRRRRRGASRRTCWRSSSARCMRSA